jgi:hypothetical protein
MTATLRSIVPPRQLATAATTQYTVPTGIRTNIIAATVTNTDTVARTFSVNVVASGDSVGNANRIISNRTVQPDETYNCWEIISHALESGSFISTTASAATALTLWISGREVS